MAITTSAKRQSAFVDPWGVVLPDGTIDAADRETLLGQYGGIPAAPPSGGGGSRTDFVGVSTNTGSRVGSGFVGM